MFVEKLFMANKLAGMDCWITEFVPCRGDVVRGEKEIGPVTVPLFVWYVAEITRDAATP